VSRVLILLMFVLWLAWKPEYCRPTGLGGAQSLALFLGGYALLVLGTGLWSRWLARRLTGRNFGRSLRRFNRLMFVARALVPIWFAAGVAGLRWWQSVNGHLQLSDFDLTPTIIGVVLGTLPAFLAWSALWWAQYPAEIAFREQNLLAQLDADLPVHRPPTFANYFAANVRLQLLFMVVPVLMIVLLHDLIRLAASIAVGSGWRLNDPENPFTWLAAAALVFVLAPEALRRVLHTEPLASSPLRRRLEALCRRTGVKYRQILLWHTHNNLCNAAVMGVLPRVRYILLSDLLLETMTDEQIEAVFAHELGHIVHRHMAWLVVFITVLMLFNLGGGPWVTRWVEALGLSDHAQVVQGVFVASSFLFQFLVLFGFGSRRFERQADVFAARTMELSRPPAPPAAAPDLVLVPNQLPAPASGGAVLMPAARLAPALEPGHVGHYGAAVFGSALERVALVNNIPIKARSWCHGSIATRMRYLQELSADPTRTARFDRFMLLLYGALVFALFAGAAFCWASNALP